MKTTKLNKEQIEKIKKEVEDAPLKALKTEFDRYVDTIVRYRFKDTCIAGAYFNNLFHDSIQNVMKNIDESKLKEAEKYKLQNEVIFIFRKEKPTEEQLKQEEIEYWKSLVGWAKNSLFDLTKDEKKKIIIDGIKQIKLWSDQMDRNSKVYDKLNKPGNQSNKEEGTLTRDKISANKKQTR